MFHGIRYRRGSQHVIHFTRAVGLPHAFGLRAACCRPLRALTFVAACVFAHGLIGPAHTPALGQTTEFAQLQQTIQLRGLPDDDVPVVTSVAIQPSGNLLATSGDDHVVRLWDLRTGELKRSLRAHSDWVTCVQFSADGSHLITGSRDRRLLTWDLARSNRPTPLGRHEHPISGLAVDPATGLIAVVGFRAPLKVFSADTGRLVAKHPCPCLDTRAITFSPSGLRLAAGGRNGKLRIWDLQTGDHIDLSAHPRRITAVIFGNDQMLLSAGEDRTVRLWDAQGQELQSMSHESGKVLAMAMLDENRFAAATTKNLIPIFDISRPHPIAILEGHTGSVATLVAHQQRLISGSFDTTVRIWRILDNSSGSQAAKEVAPPTRRTSVSKLIESTPSTIE